MLKQNPETASSVAIAASFTVEPLQPALEYLLREMGLQLGVEIAPYHQVLQQLLSVTSALSTQSTSVNVLLIRLEDYVRDIGDSARAERLIAETAIDFRKAIDNFAQRSKVPTVLALFPPSPDLSSGLQQAVSLANMQVLQYVSKLAGLSIVTPAEINAVSMGERYDEESDRLGHIPFTESHYAALALAVSRKIHSVLILDRKVLVLDCDNTLWRGVVGEDGVDGITIAPAFARLQEFATEIQSRGVLICLASKNSEHDVIEVFKKRSDMVLKLHHIVSHRINWNSKPQSIASLAQELNLGLDSFVFIDDNPVECELMRNELPQVITLLLPPESSIESFLSHLWVFDKAAVTEEDRRRTSLYKEDAARKELERNTSNIVDFVASLRVLVDIDEPDSLEWPRLAQLTQRTNQFNFSTIRRTETELRSLSSQAGSVLRVRVSDRFGDYGLVGLVISRTEKSALVVDTFLLSCRVLGRGVEHTILAHLGKVAEQNGLDEVQVPFVESARNEPARAFVESIAAQFREPKDGYDVYRIPTSAALKIQHRPGHDPESVIRARDSEGKKTSVQSSIPGASERYTFLSQRLLTGLDVVNALAETSARKRSLPGSPVLPATEGERKMLELWQDVLGIRDLGVEDDYSALGGTSLLAARLFARIVQQYGLRLPLTTILEYSTVRALARVIDVGSSHSESLIELHRGEGERSFFFVHDGDGETLLYRNIAQRFPKCFSVFGIEPRQISGVPLAHSTLEGMATDYVDAMRKKQPAGPYYIGGMCAGGVIAFEMARQLEECGEFVELVVLLDAALPKTAKRAGRITRERMGRLSKLLEDSSGRINPVVLILAVISKLANAVTWEFASSWRRSSVKLRFRLLQLLLNRKAGWPSFVRSLSVREIYESAESLYNPRGVTSAMLLLVRARSGDGGDTPFREIYADEALGWTRRGRRLLIEDVDGGHYTMLQKPYADRVAEKISPYLQTSLTAPQVEPVFKITA